MIKASGSRTQMKLKTLRPSIPPGRSAQRRRSPLGGVHGRCLTDKSHDGRPSNPATASQKCVLQCYHERMRTSVIFDDRLAAEAREFGINVSEAAREGLRQAVHRRRAEHDRAAYQALPEQPDADWEDAEAWGQP